MKSYVYGTKKASLKLAKQNDIYALGYLLFRLGNNKPLYKTIYNTGRLKEYYNFIIRSTPEPSKYTYGTPDINLMINNLIDSLIELYTVLKLDDYISEAKRINEIYNSSTKKSILKSKTL